MREWTEKHIRELIDQEYNRLKTDGPGPGGDNLKKLRDNMKGKTHKVFGLAAAEFPISVQVKFIDYEETSSYGLAYWKRDITIQIDKTIPNKPGSRYTYNAWFTFQPSGWDELTGIGQLRSSLYDFPNGASFSITDTLETDGIDYPRFYFSDDYPQREMAVYPAGFSDTIKAIVTSPEVPAGVYIIHANTDNTATTEYQPLEVR